MHDASIQINSARREAEKTVIAAILRGEIAPDDYDLTGLEFSNVEYQNIVVAALDLTQDGSDIDLVALSNYLDVHKAEETTAPSPLVLTRLAQSDTPINVRPAIKLVHTYKARTELSDLSDKLSEWVKDQGDNPLDIVERATKTLDKIRGRLGREVVNYKHLSEIAPAVQQEYDDYLSGHAHNIPTGIPQIDNVTAGGGAAGDLWVIGAPSGQGKSALVLHFARHQTGLGYPVLLISREMLPEENYKRIHSSIADVPVYLMRPGIEEFLYERLGKTMPTVNQHPIYIDGISADIKTIGHSIKHAVENVGVKAVYVDYLQLIKSTKKSQRAEEVAEVSRALKEYAMDNRIWICALAQYNRASIVSGQIENHSFSDSSQIEKDASIILHLELEKVEKTERIPQWRKASLYMGKGRNAPNVNINLQFRGETFEFRYDGY